MKIKPILLLLLIASCSPRFKTVLSETKYPPLNENDEILVLNDKANIVFNSTSIVGEIKDPFEKTITSPKATLKGCGYTEIINELKNKAKELGANIIHTYDIKSPNLTDNCYKIKARLYRDYSSQLIGSINAYNELIYNFKPDKKRRLCYDISL